MNTKLQHIAFVLLLAGCTALEQPASAPATGEPAPAPVDLVFTATREAVDPGTKTVRLDNGSVWWSPQEVVSVFYGNGTEGGGRFVSKNEVLAETTSFSGSIQMTGTGKNFWAVYPYSQANECDGESLTLVVPAVQTGVEGNFSDNAFPAVATSKTLKLPFWNVCGGVKFFVTRSDIKSFAIRGNGGEPLAGKVKVRFGQYGQPEVAEVLEAKTEVVLRAPDGGTFEPGAYYYASLLPCELPNGITVTLKTASQQGIMTSSNPQTVRRCTFGTLKNINGRVSSWQDREPDPDEFYQGIVINEVAAHADSDGFDSWVEIVNTTDKQIALTGLSLFLSGSKIADLTGTLPAGARKVVSTADRTLSTGISSNAAFTLVLGQDASSPTDTFVRGADYPSLGMFASYQRIPDGTGEWKRLTYSSPGSENEVFDVSKTRPTAVWAWGSHLSDLVASNGAKMRDMKDKGYNHILMNFSGFSTSSYRQNAIKFMKIANEIGLTVHVWIQCFYDGGWISPIDDTNKCFKEAVYESIRNDARSYLENWGVKGVHLDYIRFAGTASKHNWTSEVNSVNAVNRCCREIREVCDSFEEGIVTSAALMPEPNSESSYGQNPAQMSQYIHILMPMIYRYGDYNFSDATFKSRSNYYADQAATHGGMSWSGIQTYDANTKGLSAEALRSDIDLMAATRASGIVLFRYQLGTFPDINDLWPR
ncbi:MAG: lamin tail domain-containing protein [Bacteroidales bacterium]|nr:lamin tail domain-containing protein [Bacteroidales bacterium]